MAAIKISDLLNKAGGSRLVSSKANTSGKETSVVKSVSQQLGSLPKDDFRKSTMSESPRALDDLVLSLEGDRDLLSSKSPVATARETIGKNEASERKWTPSEDMVSIYTSICGLGQESEAALRSKEQKCISLSSSVEHVESQQRYKSIHLVPFGNVNQDRVTEGPKLGSETQVSLFVKPVKNASAEFSVSGEEKRNSGTERKWTTETLPMNNSIRPISNGNKPIQYRKLQSSSKNGALNIGKGERQGSTLRQRRAKRRNAVVATKLENGYIDVSDKDLINDPGRMLEKRMKNRAAVNKCRLKQKERLDQLEEEQRDLIKENRLLREMLETLERNGVVNGSVVEIVRSKHDYKV